MTNGEKNVCRPLIFFYGYMIDPIREISYKQIKRKKKNSSDYFSYNHRNG